MSIDKQILAPNKVNKVIADRLLKLRKSLGMTQIQVEKAADVKPGTTHRIESGGQSVSIENLIRLCSVYDVHVADIIGVQFAITLNV